MTTEPHPEHIDFMALAAIPTNEQRIVAALERSEALLEKIVELLTPPKWTPPTPEVVEVLKGAATNSKPGGVTKVRK